MARIRRISSKTDLVKYIVLKRNIRNIFVKTIRTLIGLTILAILFIAIYYRGNISMFLHNTNQLAQTKISRFYLDKMKGMRVKLQKKSLIDVDGITQFVVNYTSNKDNRYNAMSLIDDVKHMYPIIEDVSIRYDITHEVAILHIKEKQMLGVLLANGCDGKVDSHENKLITKNGVIIDYVKIVNGETLLPVCGDFHNGQDLSSIKQELIKYKLYDKVKYIKFYTSGRFELMLSNNLLVKMPQKDWNMAILKFLKMDSEYALSTGNKHIKYIDLRLKDKVYVKEL